MGAGRAILRRELGSLGSYAAIVGMLVGAGIFRVTSDAWVHTGASVVLGYLVLAPAVFANSMAYVVFGSTSLGERPGGDYAHIAATLGSGRLAFLAAWLKLISYVGAAAFLGIVLADYLIELDDLFGGPLEPGHRVPLGLCSLFFFYAMHSLGVRWFGRLQAAMCGVLVLAIAILVVPGLFAIEFENYRPFFSGGPVGFAAALPPLFFAYAGFEALAHAGGEMQDSRRSLPRVFVLGLVVATCIFVSMAAVALGVLPGEVVGESRAPMAEAASRYLPRGAAALVAVGGVMAVATSLNATLLVPARLGVVLADDRCVPGWTGWIHAGTGAPRVGLFMTFACAALLLASGQFALALNGAIFALMLVYALHSLTLLMLPARNPALFAEISVRVPASLRVGAAWLSVLTMGGLIGVRIVADIAHLGQTTLGERWADGSLTAVELVLGWGLVGALLYTARGRRAACP